MVLGNEAPDNLRVVATVSPKCGSPERDRGPLEQASPVPEGWYVDTRRHAQCRDGAPPGDLSRSSRSSRTNGDGWQMGSTIVVGPEGNQAVHVPVSKHKTRKFFGPADVSITRALHQAAGDGKLF